MSARKGIDHDCLVSVIAPLSNDGQILRSFVHDLQTVLRAEYANYEIIFIDDGSTDGTPNIMRDLLSTHQSMRYLRLSRRFGIETAIAAGFETAIGDYVVVLMPEFDPVADIPLLVQRVRNHGTVIIGHAQGAVYGFPYRMIYRAFYWLCNRFLALDLHPNTTYFIALSRPLLNSINQIRDKFRYIKTFTNFLGFRSELHNYTLQSRSGKEWGRGLFEAINLAIDIVVSNSIRPLRYVSLLGLGVSGIYFLYFGYIALIAFFKDDVAEGWVTLSTQNALAFFVLNIVLATVSEYIGRLLLESKERPAYFVVEEKNSSVLITGGEGRLNVVHSSTGTVLNK